MEDYMAKARRPAAEKSPFKSKVETVKVARIDFADQASGTAREWTEDDGNDNCSGKVKSLELRGNYLIGAMECGQEAAVCHRRYLPALIEELKKLL
jgi:hypothetical protein